MKQLYYVGLVLICVGLLILQTTFFPRFALAGVFPRPVLVFVVIYGLLRDPVAGGIMGAVYGLFQDLVGFKIPGVNLLAKGLIGFFAGFLRRFFFRDNILVPLFATGLATILNEGLFFLVLEFGLGLDGWAASLKRYLPYLMLYNMLLVPFIYYPLCYYEKRYGRKPEE